MQKKETAQMQLWTDEGYRNIWCSKCRKQSRCQDWRCRHDLVWNECPIHRQDPEQHRTIRSAQSLGKLAPPVTLLSSERPEPESKSRKQCRRKLNAAIKRKCVIQSTHPAFYNVDLSKCPKLAAKVIGFSLRQEPETGEDVCHSATLHSQCASRGVDDIPSIQRERVFRRTPPMGPLFLAWSGSMRMSDPLQGQVVVWLHMYSFSTQRQLVQLAVLQAVQVRSDCSLKAAALSS